MIQYDIETGAFVYHVADSGYPMQFHTDIALPTEALDENQFYSLRDMNGNVPVFSDENCKWVVKQRQVSTIAYNKQTQKQQLFDDESLVTDDYTLLKPVTQFDEWINNAWVTNKQTQYEAQVKQVDATRRSLYLNVDALRNEAAMIRMLSTDETKAADEAKAADYERQAKDLYLKIRNENPWPTAPTAEQ